MDSLTGWILTNLSFFASGIGILVIGVSALLTILLWDWRVALVGLLVVQTGVVVLTSTVYQLPLAWSNVQLLVTALCAAMMALSARQVHSTLRLQRPGSWLVRLSAIILLGVSWQYVDLTLTLPLLTPQVAGLFLWLALCALVLLGLSDSPLYTSVALFFWFIPVQAFIQILLPDQRLFVLIGIVEIFIGLACSYLLLAHRIPVRLRAKSLTDVTFPEENAPPLTLPGPDWAPRLGNEGHNRGEPNGARRTLPPIVPTNRPGNGGSGKLGLSGPTTPATDATGEHAIPTQNPS
jgi:hypothetical protein